MQNTTDETREITLNDVVSAGFVIAGFFLAFSGLTSMGLVVVSNDRTDWSILMGILLTVIAGITFGLIETIKVFTGKDGISKVFLGIGLGVCSYVWYGLYDFGSSNHLTVCFVICSLSFGASQYVGEKLIHFRASFFHELGRNQSE